MAKFYYRMRPWVTIDFEEEVDDAISAKEAERRGIEMQKEFKLAIERAFTSIGYRCSVESLPDMTVTRYFQ